MSKSLPGRLKAPEEAGKGRQLVTMKLPLPSLVRLGQESFKNDSFGAVHADWRVEYLGRDCLIWLK